MRNKNIKDTKNSNHYLWGAECNAWHLVQSEELSVIQEIMPPGSAETPHYHTKSQQFFYVLSGEAKFELGRSSFKLKQSQGVHVLPGTKHRIMNETDQDLVLLVISNPFAHGDRTDLE